MSDHFYKDELYPLQDRVLRIVQQSGAGLYLTGGTFLSRFLLHHRYSDDLDFFANQSNDFKAIVQLVIKQLTHSFPKNQLMVNDESFVRFFISENDVTLKIDFVNDVAYRAGVPERLENGTLVDSWMNVLSNKVSALERNAAKDFIDILFLSLRYPFNWEEVLGHARRKDDWINEISVSQHFMSFDLQKLSEVIFPSTFNLKGIEHSYFKTMARESLHGFDNSLAGKQLI
jgi:hypothetical protein